MHTFVKRRWAWAGLTQESNATHSNAGGKGVDVVLAVTLNIGQILRDGDDNREDCHEDCDETAGAD